MRATVGRTPTSKARSKRSWSKSKSFSIDRQVARSPKHGKTRTSRENTRDKRIRGTVSSTELCGKCLSNVVGNHKQYGRWVIRWISKVCCELRLLLDNTRDWRRTTRIAVNEVLTKRHSNARVLRCFIMLGKVIETVPCGIYRGNHSVCI